MKLYHSPLSPYARKCRILARLHALNLEEVQSSGDGAKGYTGGVNPLGKVPALETPKGLLVDSPVICEYLDSLAAKPLLPPVGQERFEQLNLHAIGDGLSDAVYNYRYETVREDSLHWEQMIARHDYAIRYTITHIAGRVDELGRGWQFGNLSIICALDYADFRAGHYDWRAEHADLARWHKDFTKDKAWRETYAYPAK